MENCELIWQRYKDRCGKAWTSYTGTEKDIDNEKGAQDSDSVSLEERGGCSPR